MKLNNAVMLVSGVMVLVSLALTTYIDASFIYLTIFVGFMMIQSSFTKFCPVSIVLKALCVKK